MEGETDHDADVWLLHKDRTATKIGSMRDGVNGIKYWKTWRGSDEAGKPNMGYQKSKYYKQNSDRDMFFTFGDRIYYYFKPSDDIGREHKYEIWYLDLSNCRLDGGGPLERCLRIDVTNIPKRPHGYMVQVRIIILLILYEKSEFRGNPTELFGSDIPDKHIKTHSIGIISKITIPREFTLCITYEL